MSEQSSETARIDRACHRLLTDPGLEPLLLWWQATGTDALMPDGPVDPVRLAMTQGDRERLSRIKQRAARHMRSMTNAG